MNKKDIEGMQKILKNYIELSKYANLIKKEYFSVGIEGAKKLLEKISEEKSTEVIKEKRKEKPKAKVGSKKEIEEIYLKYIKGGNTGYTKYKVDELKEMYKMLYEVDTCKGNKTKKVLAEAIEEYFESNKRLNSMKL